jgi:hypothetical protein
MSGPQRDFAGRNGQVWFVGVIEGKKDPAKVGRLQVRIIGWHDENTNLLPTEDLPWALISLPVNGSRNVSLPKEGDWVHGFFLDGYAGQQPLITGVIPGVVSKTPKTPTGATQVLAALEAQLVVETNKLNGMLAGQNDATLKQKRAAQQTVVNQKQAAYDAAVAKRDKIAETVNQTLLYNIYQQAVEAANTALTELNAEKAKLASYTTASSSEIEKQKAVVNQLQSEISQLKIGLNRATPLGFCDVATYAEVDTRPATPEGVVTDRKDEPSLPALARGVITNTGIELSDKNLAHACDVTPYIRQSMAAARIATGQIAQAIRAGIKALLAGFGTSPGSSAIAEYIKSLGKLLNRITKIIKEINDYVELFNTYVQQIKAIIEYILSLPEQLLAIFKKCLSEAYAEIARGLALIVGDFSVGTGGEFSQISQATKETLNELKNLTTEAVKLYSAPAQIIGSLTNPSTLSAAERESLIAGLFPDSQKHDETSYSKAIM